MRSLLDLSRLICEGMLLNKIPDTLEASVDADYYSRGVSVTIAVKGDKEKFTTKYYFKEQLEVKSSKNEEIVVLDESKMSDEDIIKFSKIDTIQSVRYFKDFW